MPLPTALVKFPSPALQHGPLSTMTGIRIAGHSEEHMAAWRTCTGESYGMLVGRYVQLDAVMDLVQNSEAIWT